MPPKRTNGPTKRTTRTSLTVSTGNKNTNTNTAGSDTDELQSDGTDTDVRPNDQHQQQQHHRHHDGYAVAATSIAKRGRPRKQVVTPHTTEEDDDDEHNNNKKRRSDHTNERTKGQRKKVRRGGNDNSVITTATSTTSTLPTSPASSMVGRSAMNTQHTMSHGYVGFVVCVFCGDRCSLGSVQNKYLFKGSSAIKRCDPHMNGTDNDMSLLTTVGPYHIRDNRGPMYCHWGCARWSSEVRTHRSGLHHITTAILRASTSICSICHQSGGTLTCHRRRCGQRFHYQCARANGVTFNVAGRSDGGGLRPCLLCKEHTNQRSPQPTSLLSSSSLSSKSLVGATARKPKNNNTPTPATANKKANTNNHNDSDDDDGDTDHNTTHSNKHHDDSKRKPSDSKVDSNRKLDNADTKPNRRTLASSKGDAKSKSNAHDKNGGDDRYVVDHIRGRRHYQGQLQYLVQWRGYDALASTWENAHDIDNKNGIAEFDAYNPGGPNDTGKLTLDSLMARALRKRDVPQATPRRRRVTVSSPISTTPPSTPPSSLTHTVISNPNVSPPTSPNATRGVTAAHAISSPSAPLTTVCTPSISSLIASPPPPSSSPSPSSSSLQQPRQQLTATFTAGSPLLFYCASLPFGRADVMSSTFVTPWLRQQIQHLERHCQHQ